MGKEQDNTGEVRQTSAAGTALSRVASERYQNAVSDLDLSELCIEEVISILHTDIKLSRRVLSTIPAHYTKQFSDETLSALERIYSGDLYPASIGFNWAPIVQAGLPHRKVKGHQHYTRRNGNLTVTYSTPDHHFVPYGVAGRHILTHIVTQLVRDPNDLTISFCESPTEFIRGQGATPTSGKRGNIQLYRKALLAVANLSIHVTDTTEGRGGELYSTEVPLTVGKVVHSIQDRSGQFHWGKIELNEQFAFMVSQRPVPFSFDAYMQLTETTYSTLALDLLTWLSYRVHTMKSDALVRIPWANLQEQFGYTSSRRTFLDQFRDALQEVQAIWPSLVVQAHRQEAFVLFKSEPLIPPRLPAQAV